MNKIVLILLVTLIIILSIILYYYQRKTTNNLIFNSELVPEEVLPLEEEESGLFDFHNLENNNPKDLLFTNKIQFNNPPININLSPQINLQHNSQINDLDASIINLERQFKPYLNYPVSGLKKLTTSNECLSKSNDSCPLRSYKQCSNNYPLPDYNSFDVCNCNVNKICPYQSDSAKEKPAIKLECPLVYNQENKTLVLP